MQTYQQDCPWLPLIKLQSLNPNFYILSCLWFLPVILFLSLLFTWSLQKLWSSVCVCVCVCVWVHTHAQSCLALCNPMDCSPLASSVHGIFQVRILEWLAISYSRGSSQPRDQTCLSCVSCIGRQIL